jgi:hypothetical protein
MLHLFYQVNEFPITNSGIKLGYTPTFLNSLMRKGKKIDATTHDKRIFFQAASVKGHLFYRTNIT